MPYITFDQLKALVPDGWVTAALDDDSSGDAEKFEDVRGIAEMEVNGALEGRYAIPLPEPLPQLVVTVTNYIAAEVVYGRRNMQDHFPYKDALAVYRRTLRDIGAGKQPLKPELDRKKPSVSVISEPSKVHSGHGHMLF